MANIALIDIDSKNFPNIALMKISAYHKMLGDNVGDWYAWKTYDKIYKSKVFTFTKDLKVANAKEVIQGGTGYNLENKLPIDIDNMFPDYSLYNITDTAYGYLTRGCPRQCAFCIVSKKEGIKTEQKYKLSQFWNGQKNIKLLDPNITAAPNSIELFEELADTKAWVDFTQGLDLRLMTEKKIEAIKKIKIKMMHFAWDNIEDEKIICEKLTMFKEMTNIDYRKLTVYILTNFNTTFEQDLYRVYKVKELGASPYVMVYNRQTAEKKYKLLQRYSKPVFRKIKTFEEYSGKYKKDVSANTGFNYGS